MGRQRSAKPLFVGSNPTAASNSNFSKGEWWNGIHVGLKIQWSQDRKGSNPFSPIETSLGGWRSWLARNVDIVEVTGSTPVPPTITIGC